MMSDGHFIMDQNSTALIHGLNNADKQTREDGYHTWTFYTEEHTVIYDIFQEYKYEYQIVVS